MAPKPIPRDAFFLSDEAEECVNYDFKIKHKVVELYDHVDECRESNLVNSCLSASSFNPRQSIVGGSVRHTHSHNIQGKLPITDRIIVLQSISHNLGWADVADTLEDDEETLEEERLIVNVQDDDVCIGDVFGVSGSTLKLRVASPRVATRNSWAGWFCDVLCEGSTGEGSELMLMERPLPHWTHRQLATAVYGSEGDSMFTKRLKPSWGRSLFDLEELLALPYSSHSEWWSTVLRKLHRQEKEKRQPIPYLDSLDDKSDRTVASVLGLYGRDAEYNEFMPRLQVQEAHFAPVQGMRGHDFWQMTDDEGFIKNKSERAVLLQSIQAYRRVQTQKFGRFPETDIGALVDPCFGEQIILDIPGDICIGDMYRFPGSTLILRVTSPRKPCSELDRKNRTAFGTKGIRHLTNSNALAGWFCEVLTEGPLVKGSIMELVERPNPQWTIEELATALYGGEGDPRAILRGIASWGRPIEQLRELISIPYLAECEWKEEMRWLLERMEAEPVISHSTVVKGKVSRVDVGIQHGNKWLSLLLVLLVAMFSCVIVVASGD